MRFAPTNGNANVDPADGDQYRDRDKDGDQYRDRDKDGDRNSHSHGDRTRDGNEDRHHCTTFTNRDSDAGPADGYSHGSSHGSSADGDQDNGSTDDYERSANGDEYICPAHKH